MESTLYMSAAETFFRISHSQFSFSFSFLFCVVAYRINGVTSVLNDLCDLPSEVN